MAERRLTKFHIGIDLGGTKIEVAALNKAHDIIFRERVETEANKGSEHILNQIFKAYQSATQYIKNATHSVGVGTPGSISIKSGLLRNSNTTCLNGLPLQKLIEKKLNTKLILENDANCFALAEAIMGAATNYNLVFGVIMGTGCGGGFVINKQLRIGPQLIAGEWGHSIINPMGPKCYCGKQGCVETYISGSGLENDIKKKLKQHITAKDFLNKKSYSQVEKKIIDNFYYYFGLSLSNIINIIDPDVIVLGGGLSQQKELYSYGKQEVYKNIFSDYCMTPIIKNKLGDSAGVIGAALIGAKLVC
jgi:fructokinase